MSEKRKFSGNRLYKLTKWIVIVISTLSLILAIVSYMDVQVNNTTLNNWKDYCEQNPDNPKHTGLPCTAVGLKQIDDMQNAMNTEFTIGVFMPRIFWRRAII